MHLLVALLWLGGCAPSVAKLAPDAPIHGRRIVVVAVEPPPFSMNEGASSADSVAALLNHEVTWRPAIIVAQIAAELLRSAIGRDVVVHESPLVLTTVDNREVTWHMHNWYGPIMDWYDQDPSCFHYSEPVVHPLDLVIETSMSKFEYFKGTLSLNVSLRVVDPRDRRVLAKSYRFFTRPFNRESVVANGGAGLKIEFQEISRQLLIENLLYVGLLSHPPAPALRSQVF